MKKYIKTEITIKATPKRVWANLCNFDNYPNWNPIITSIKGKLTQGNKLQLKMGAKGWIRFKPTVVVVIKNKKFTLQKRFICRRILTAVHAFELNENEEGITHFVQSVKFTGLLVGLVKSKKIGKSFNEINIELKKLVENKNGTITTI